jgi:hypothetical protein
MDLVCETTKEPLLADVVALRGAALRTVGQRPAQVPMKALIMPLVRYTTGIQTIRVNRDHVSILIIKLLQVYGILPLIVRNAPAFVLALPPPRLAMLSTPAISSAVRVLSSLVGRVHDGAGVDIRVTHQGPRR